MLAHVGEDVPKATSCFSAVSRVSIMGRGPREALQDGSRGPHIPSKAVPFQIIKMTRYSNHQSVFWEFKQWFQTFSMEAQ